MKEGIELTVDNTRIEFKRELILEHLPEELEKGRFYRFEVRGYVVFPLGRAISLFIKDPQKQIASIEITQQTHYLLAGIYTPMENILLEIKLGKK